METLRKPLQGLGNSVRFNYPFYVWSLGLVATLFLAALVLQPGYLPAASIACFLISLPIAGSLLASWYVYDYSDLYHMRWLEQAEISKGQVIANINAGFDETSALLKRQFPQSQLLVFDFYDPLRHTEASIKRARRAYPPFEPTISISTSQVPVAEASVDAVILTMSAHEIRNAPERIVFFRELARILKPGGCIVVTEHLRDLPNFMAYTIGFLHFHSRKTWLQTFAGAGLVLAYEQKTTPFITTFILKTHGTTS